MMGYRKWMAIFVTIIMILALFPAVGVAEGDNNGCNDCEPIEVVDLIAGQDEVVGTVTVTNDSEKICVTYALDEDALAAGWLIYETHLYIGDCAFDGVLTPTNTRLGGPYNANPIPGAFPYGDDDLGGVPEWSDCISFDDLGFGICNEVCIAAHAVVKRVVEDAYCQTVVEAGDKSFVSDTDTMVVVGNVLGADYPESAVLAWQPFNPNNNYWDNNLTGHTFDAEAKWIWESYRVVNPILGDVVTFEKEFEIPGPPLDGTLFITADNGFAAYLNGVEVGVSPTLPLYPNLGNLTEAYVNTNGWQNVQQIDLTNELGQGTNTLKIVAANEYMGSLDNQANGTIDNNPGGVIFEFDVEWDKVEDCYPEDWEDQTAWGEGNRFNEKGNWGMWFKYKICEPEDPCTPSGIFGILSQSASGSLAGSIYEIETETDTFVGTQIYQNNATYPHPYGNALALDAENRRLYFTLSTSGSVATDLYFYDFDADTIVNAHPTAGWADAKNVCGAAFGDGYYWYIPDNSTSLRKISFNPNGTVNQWEQVATLSPVPGGFGDIVYKDGVIYGSTQTRYFTYNIASGDYTTHASVASVSNAHNSTGINLQLAWGSDGNLYGHSYINKTWWLVTPSTGESTFLYTGTISYGDLADGFRCD